MKIEDVIAKIEEIGHRRGMKSSDIEAIKQSLKHFDKKKVKIIVDKPIESV